MSENISIRSIIEKAGGAAAIEKAAVKQGRKITSWAVYKWSNTGIPEKHWSFISEISGVAHTECHFANEALREENAA